MIRVADFIAKTIADCGVKHIFIITGGGAMFLDDAIGKENRLKYVCNHHEQACAMAADGSHPPEFIPRLWNERQNCDNIVIASRYIKGGHTENPWLLVFLSQILNLFFKSIIQFPILDGSNSFRLYNGLKLRSIKLTYQHFDILEEILARLFWDSNDSVTVAEVPFSFEKRYSGK